MEENDQKVNPPQNESLIQQQAPTPSNPVSDKSKLKLPIIIAGIVIFLLLLGSVSAAFLTQKSNNKSKEKIEVAISPQTTTLQTSPMPTNNSTSDWKTFENNTYSISYPSTLTENTDSESSFLDLYSSDYEDDGGLPTITKGFIISVCVKNYCKPSFEEYEKQQFNNPPFEEVEKITWLNSPSTLYRREFIQISYDIFPDDASVDVSISINTPLEGGEEIFNTNKELIYAIANTLKLK